MGRGCDDMERAFLEEFRTWWPFAKERLVEGGWLTFSVSLEVKGREGYFVRGSIESSEKVKPDEKKAATEAA